MSISLIDMYLYYHKQRTSASLRYAKHCGLQLIGHSMGRNSMCWIAPNGIHFNTQIILMGKSTKSLKSTSTDDVEQKLVPMIYRGPDDFTPQGLLKSMEEQEGTSSVLLNQHEFQIIIKKVTQTGGGAWSDWVGMFFFHIH